jgi:PPOX class probable F420-dependent enzyme
MDDAEALERLTRAPVARLATVSPLGHPHVVPIVFAVIGATLVHMIDHKPKKTTRLQRLRNLEANPRASVLVDHYDDDWAGLWWVRVDGNAAIETVGARWDQAQAALVAKYQQYLASPPEGPAILLGIDGITHWESN